MQQGLAYGAKRRAKGGRFTAGVKEAVCEEHSRELDYFGLQCFAKLYQLYHLRLPGHTPDDMWHIWAYMVSGE